MIKPIIYKNIKTGFWQVKYPADKTWKDLSQYEKVLFNLSYDHVATLNILVRLKRATKCTI